MKRTMIRYKVKVDCAAENEGYVTRVFQELEREQPAGLSYASFKLDDDVSFVHIVSVDGNNDRNPLLALSAFKAFLAKIRDRCEELPVTVNLREVGSYGFFGK